MPVRVRVASLLFLSSVLSACGTSASPEAGAPGPMEVSVATVIEREISEWDEYTGRLEAVETVEIRPQVSGYLQQVNFEEGREVKKGDVLFVIDPRPYQAEFDRAQAEAERARTAATLAEADLVRAEKLVATRAISQEEFDARKAALVSAQAAVKAAEAAVDVARLNLSYTRVTSPIDGRVGRAEVTVGNLVTGGLSGQATRLTTVVSMSPMYVYFEASERDYLKYMDLARSGQRALSREHANPVLLAVGNETDFRHQGYMDFVDNRVDAGTGTLMGRAVFPNPDRLLVPGMFARVRLLGTSKYAGTLVNDRAILTDQDRRYVLVVGEGDTLEYRAITTGPLVDGLRAVRSGLKGGERIVVNGLQRVRPGMVVRPRMVPMEGEATAAAEPAPAAEG
jgi:RND family efflux transporter MFP subunit|nr:MAG: efflux transporter periplasmic adaptor subunit [Pseudomonadota bacterium]